MKRDFLARLSRRQLVALKGCLSSIQMIYEDAYGGPSKAWSDRGYILVLQDLKEIRRLITELAE